MEGGRADLDRLPVEVIKMIISHIDETPSWSHSHDQGGTTLKSLSLTCQSLRASTFPRLYSHTKIHITVEERKTRPSHIVTVKGFCAFVAQKNLQRYIIGISRFPMSRQARVRGPQSSRTRQSALAVNFQYSSVPVSGSRIVLYQSFINTSRRSLTRRGLRLSASQTSSVTLAV